MTGTHVYKRMAAAGLALLPLLAAAPAAMAKDKTLGGYSTWTDDSTSAYPPGTPVPDDEGYLEAVCVDPSYSGYEEDGYGQYTVTSIAAAMDVVAPGGVIEVKPGAVAENLVIDKPVELRAGECYRRHAPPKRRGWNEYMQPANTHLKDILRPALVAKKGRPCVSIYTRGRVIISGFRLGAVEYGNAVCVHQAAGETLMRDNVVHGIQDSTSVYLKNGSLWMISNTLRGGRVGLDISSRFTSDDANVFIHRNRITGTETGILVRSEIPVEISENQITNTFSEAIRHISGPADIRSNILSDNAGVALSLDGEDGLNISDNKFVFNRTAVSSPAYRLDVSNFRFNHVSCNEEAGVYDISTNMIDHNPVRKTGGWFSKRKDEEALQYCSELVHTPVRLGRRKAFNESQGDLEARPDETQEPEPYDD